MRKQVYTSKFFWSQIIVWLPLFLIPIMYGVPHISWKDNLSQYIIPLSMMIVVYLNYFVLAPMLLKGCKKEFWCYNTFIIHWTTRVALLCRFGKIFRNISLPYTFTRTERRIICTAILRFTQCIEPKYLCRSSDFCFDGKTII